MTDSIRNLSVKNIVFFGGNMFKLILVIVLFSVGNSNPVKANIDSLLALINSEKIDTQVILNISKEIQGMYYTNPVSSLTYATKLDSLISDQYPMEIIASTKKTLGLAYYVNESYDDAIDNLLVSLRYYETKSDEPNTAQVLNALATVYQVRKDVDVTIDYFNRALSLFEKSNDSIWIASVSGNLGGHLMEYDKLEEAEPHLLRAIDIFKSLNNIIYLGFTQLNLGSLRVKQKKHNAAIESFKLSLSNVPYQVNPLIHAVAHTGLGQAYLELNQLPEARKNLNRGYEISEEINHFEQKKSATELLARYYEKVENYKMAFIHQQEYSVLQDSFLTAEQDDRLLNALNKYETEKREQEITLLSAENQIQDLRLQKTNRNFILSLISVVAVSLLAFQFYRSRKKTQALNTELRHQKDLISKALEEKDVLLREIHHRVKNNLQVISSLLGIQSRKVKDEAALEALNESRTRVQSMSLIHQNLYQKDNLTGIEIKAYFNKLVHNLFETYNLREGDIIINSDIDNLTLDVDTVIPLGLIINELLSNSLKYAFPENKGKIVVKLKEQKDGLFLSVSDNGIGISDPELVLKNDSYGYDLINSLVDKLEGQLSIDNNNGTQVNAIFKEYKKAA